MKNRNIIILIAALFISINLSAQESGSFIDYRDGKTYKTISIGKQTWMAENIAYKADTGCWVYANDQGNVATYGYLYDWKTAKKVCPSGWHLPTKPEMDTLVSFLGGTEVAGAKLKSDSYWKTKHDSVTGYAHVKDCAHKNTGMKHDSILINSSKFSGLPGGACYFGGVFDYKGESVNWWSSTEFNTNNSYYLYLYDASTGATIYYALNSCGFYIRCVKD